MKNVLHQQVLDNMLQYRNSHPNFKFWLRQVNRKDRLNNGIWFQGTETYAAVGLYNRGGGTNMTRSFFLAFWLGKKDTAGVNLEIVWNEETDQKIISFYKKAIDLLGGFEKLTETKYRKLLATENIKQAAFQFLENEKPQIDSLLIEMGLNETMFITEEQFQSQLQKINLIQKKDNTMLNALQKKILIQSFDNFKATAEFNSRTLQAAFIPFAQNVLKNLVKKIEIQNIDLTGLIQLFKDRSGNHIANRYIPILFEEQNLQKELLQIFENLEHKGYTGAGKNGITKLNEEQLEQVKTFLINAFETKTIEEAIKLTEEFEALNIPEVKKGVYSPWLYYINPALFPIINTKHIQFIVWLGVAPIYPQAIKLFNELKELLKVNDLGLLDMWVYEMNELRDEPEVSEMKEPLNTILYGPPGTGKTYTTIEKAIKIANPAFDLDNTRQEIKKEYQRLCNEGQIEFITFHQSLSYEDFIEGIKPKLISENKEKPEVSNDLAFEIKDGLFKAICKRAVYKPDVQTKQFQLSTNDFDKASFFKLSLGDTLNSDDDIIYDYCIKNNCIAIGWGGTLDFTGLSESETTNLAKDNGESGFALSAISYFIHYMKKDNYVLISNGNSSCRAIAKVTGDYYLDANAEIPYKQFREVEWLVKDVNIPVNEIYHKSFSQQSIYKLDKQNLKLEFFIKSPEIKENLESKTPKNFVLIIDEINRGNVSQIFGELITLLEEDKRADEPEALEVTLPYSKEKFSVPKNLYLIGTMNTADRSVEALDTALRRRFCFEEMLPNPEHDLIGIVDEIYLGDVLKNINKRLEKLLSRDHTIGHSFFINVNDEEKLYQTFYDKIIPLLQEYFFGDYGKIGLVLGKAFVNDVSKVDSEKDFFAPFEYEEKDMLLEKKVYRIEKFENDVDYSNFLTAVKSI
ncbi:MAG: AAA family ATPase [Flavobacterium sp.]|nr:AAA family ATPase [Flavobacterium sp.]